MLDRRTQYAREPRAEEICTEFHFLVATIDRIVDTLGRGMSHGSAVSHDRVEGSDELINATVVRDTWNVMSKTARQLSS